MYYSYSHSFSVGLELFPDFCWLQDAGVWCRARDTLTRLGTGLPPAVHLAGSLCWMTPPVPPDPAVTIKAARETSFHMDW